MSEHNHKEEIEKIIKEINYTWRFEEYWRRFEDGALYYKKRNESLDRVYVYKIGKDQIMKMLFDPQLEYALYIHNKFYITPSSDCINKRKYYEAYRDAVLQFVPINYTSDMWSWSFVSYILDVTLITYERDPLSQIFAYNRINRILEIKWPEHRYVCPFVYIVEPYNPDPASIFHGKYGLIAYCATIHDIISLLFTIYIKEEENINSQLFDLYKAIFRKLSHNNNKLSRLRRRDKLKACDIDFIKSIIHDEIERFNSIMRRYGIMRITIPLE